VLGDKELAQRLGQAGRETVERCFGIERYTQTLAGLLTPGGAEPVFAGAVPQP
jgi:hypothetical protein